MMIKKAKEDLDARLQAIGGCTDGNCIIVKPKGMHTNGGCRCNAEKHKMSSVVYAYKKFVDEVTK